MSKTMEEMLLDKIAETEAENTKLKAELEATQAVVDELLFGGATA